MTSDTLSNALIGILGIVFFAGIIFASIWITRAEIKVGSTIGTAVGMTVRDKKMPSLKAVGKEQTRQKKLSAKYVKVYYILGMIIGILFIVWGISRFRLAGTIDDDGNNRDYSTWAMKGTIWFIFGVVLFIVFLILLLTHAI